MASVGTAIFLILLKSYATIQTASVSMLGSLSDTALDLMASLITLIAVRYAAMPADNEHRFGHGKAEALAAMVQMSLVTVSAFIIGWRAIDRFIAGATPQKAEYGIIVSVIAILVTLGLLAYQQYVIKKTKSVAITADHLHYQSDLLLNLSVIIALAMENYFSLSGADGIIGVLIALWLLRGAWASANYAFDHLMDKELPEEIKDRLTDIARNTDGVIDVHGMRTRSSGVTDFCQFHIWVKRDISMVEVHDIMDAVENNIRAEFAGIDILIHPDPEGHKDEMNFTTSSSIH
ncbi:divalent metal cation transporter FieF [Sphingorhabdus lutea]|uniref:Divalent metal cation transporter FieF n=1 Tax=Sphingorhabdus lutea TaxID=1913578 RepID=A0A1L3JFB0_9SPHN|nr:divalent metal cation transporter FieF [Sphingorhabdus lutea]